MSGTDTGFFINHQNIKPNYVKDEDIYETL